MLEEQKIIALLKAKDHSIMSEVYDRYAPALYGVACQIVQSKTIAEDVLQDAFIKIWNNAEKYDAGKGSLFTWMLNITRNTAIDRTRSSHFRQNGKIQPLDQFVNTSDNNLSHEIDVEIIGVRKKIEILELKYRTIIDLIYFNGYTQREVAEYLELPIGTVKSRVRIALRELRTALTENARITQLLSFIIGVIAFLG